MKLAYASLIFLVVLGMVTASKATSQGIPSRPQPPTGESTGEFKFFFGGVRMPDRAVGFFREGQQHHYSQRCADYYCPVAIGEFGFGSEVLISGPKMVFQLSKDGAILTATCKAPACILTISEEATFSEEAIISPPTPFSSAPPFTLKVRSLKNLETIDIPAKARVVFTVKK